MAQRKFTEVPYEYADGSLGFALSQVRGGVEEHIMPMAMWERDTATGLYMPPGESPNPKRPRVTVDGEVSVTASAMEIYGATVDQRPPADSVPPGTAYMAVDSGQVWVSNGNDWVVFA